MTASPSVLLFGALRPAWPDIGLAGAWMRNNIFKVILQVILKVILQVILNVILCLMWGVICVSATAATTAHHRRPPWVGSGGGPRERSYVHPPLPPVGRFRPEPEGKIFRTGVFTWGLHLDPTTSL